jgi:regulatory subunit for Cdc7p protein kinase
MSSRRVPLSSNPNVVNSPLRASKLLQQQQQKRIQREEPYGQPPPAKKQILDHTTQRVLKSPSQQPVSRLPQRQGQVVPQRRNGNSYESKISKERSANTQNQLRHQEENKYADDDMDVIRTWQKHHRAKFPKLVFFFEHVPEDVRVKMARQVAMLGAVCLGPRLPSIHHVALSLTRAPFPAA